MSNLALLGGKPIRTKEFPQYNTIGDEEKRAVAEVLDSGILSQFTGTWSSKFYGGPRVKKLETEWSDFFNVKHSVSMNSATSCLYAAVGAAGVGPGDEVIVSPYTMTASASGPLIYQAIPVFADISPETFCLDPKSIRSKITSRTKAIIVVDLFGHPAEMTEIMSIAHEHNLVVIEDAAQAPFATLNDQFAGTMGHIGVYSLNYHKHIHSGEGGIAVTNDETFAEKLQLIRNHGEVVAGPKGTKDLVNTIGYNYRMTEIEAAIASEQLKKLKSLVTGRIEVAGELSKGLRGLPGLITPVVQNAATHAYYIYALRYTQEVFGIPRSKFIEALQAEGLNARGGYVRPIYWEPLYQDQIAIGKYGDPFSHPRNLESKCDYKKGLCPVTEQMHLNELLGLYDIHSDLSDHDVKDIVNIFTKVVECAGELKK